MDGGGREKPLSLPHSKGDTQTGAPMLLSSVPPSWVPSPRVRSLLASGSRSLSYFLGSTVLILAAAVHLAGSDPAAVTAWVVATLGLPYTVLLLLLSAIAFFGWVRLLETEPGDESARFWLEIGLQAAIGISTLALTYKLVGIALGIGALSGQPLTPATVQGIIRELTANFSLAFLTTAISLPVAMALRALLLLTVRRRGESRKTPETPS